MDHFQTWRIPANEASVSLWNVLFQEAHAGSMLPVQTLFTLRCIEKKQQMRSLLIVKML